MSVTMFSFWSTGLLVQVLELLRALRYLSLHIESSRLKLEGFSKRYLVFMTMTVQILLSTPKKSAKPQKSKTYNSQYSLVVTHPTTNWPLTRFSWPIGREAELSGCYGRMYYLFNKFWSMFWTLHWASLQSTKTPGLPTSFHQLQNSAFREDPSNPQISFSPFLHRLRLRIKAATTLQPRPKSLLTSPTSMYWICCRYQVKNHCEEEGCLAPNNRTNLMSLHEQ